MSICIYPWRNPGPGDKANGAWTQHFWLHCWGASPDVGAPPYLGFASTFHLTNVDTGRHCMMQPLKSSLFLNSNPSAHAVPLTFQFTCLGPRPWLFPFPRRVLPDLFFFPDRPSLIPDLTQPFLALHTNLSLSFYFMFSRALVTVCNYIFLSVCLLSCFQSPPWMQTP